MSYNGPERRAHQPTRAFKQAIREFGHEPTGRWHHIFRDFVPLIAVLGLIYAVVGIEGKVDQSAVEARVAAVEAQTAKDLARTQSNGRRVALGVTCGALRGVEDAGRMALTQRLPGTKRYIPPSTARERRIREVFARSYNRVITDRIVKEAGAAGDEVIEPNGSVNCNRLREVAAAPKP
jgi:hypothetical protein